MPTSERRPPTGLRIAAAVMGLVFVAFAALQLNDPDPEIWATLYVAVALVSAAAAAGRPWPIAIAVLGVATLAWAAPLLLQLGAVTWAEIFGSFTMKTAAIEESREGLGLLIVSVWMAVLWFFQARRNQ
jgi:hypothetical protein